MKKVLVVDDTKNIRMLLEKTMQMEGFAVETASTGSEGLDKIRANSYDLIFLDIKLPEVSGTEVLRKIRAENINTPVIIITAYPTVKNAVDCVQLGAITYLQKPFTADRLKNILSQFNINVPDTNVEMKPETKDKIKKAFEDSNFNLAVELLSGLLSKNPSDAKIYRALAKAFKGLGEDAKAEKFMKAYEIFKD